MSDQNNQETAELRTQIILEYMKLGPSIFAGTYERFARPGVTFTDKQKEMIQERMKEGKSEP